MITRCVETDLRKMAQKITDDMHPHEKFSIQRFEENLTRRGPKSHFFHFTTVSIGGTDKAGKVGAVSLSGICAPTAIADREEMKDASTEIEDLFEGVGKNEVVVCRKENTDTYVKSVKVVQAIYTSLVSKVPGKTLGCITTKDASELLRKNLNECTKLLRARGHFNAIEYKKWAKIYYQVSLLTLLKFTIKTAIADREEMKDASTEIEDLFEGVGKNEVVVCPKENTDTYVKSVKVVQAIYTSLVSKVPGKTLGCITTKDASELLRKNLNECTKLLRARGHFNAIEYKKWAKIYYQVSVLNFGEQGLTPYKLKLLLMPLLVVSNFIRSPWELLSEALEKSNHHANKDFQSGKMRGGGRLHNQDPLFLEMFFFSFCKFIKTGKCTHTAGDVLRGTNPIPLYLQVCQKSLEFLKFAVGEKRPSSPLLSGLRFYVLGTFGCTAAAVAGKKAKPSLAPKAMVKKWIHDLGGTVLTKDNAQTILRGHSKTPNCFLLLKDDKDLVKGTMTAEERLQNRVAKNESRTDLESSDTGQKPR